MLNIKRNCDFYLCVYYIQKCMTLFNNKLFNTLREIWLPDLSNVLHAMKCPHVENQGCSKFRTSLLKK